MDYEHALDDDIRALGKLKAARVGRRNEKRSHVHLYPSGCAREQSNQRVTC
jgi:hypothetical protein